MLSIYLFIGVLMALAGSVTRETSKDLNEIVLPVLIVFLWPVSVFGLIHSKIKKSSDG